MKIKTITLFLTSLVFANTSHALILGTNVDYSVGGTVVNSFSDTTTSSAASPASISSKFLQGSNYNYSGDGFASASNESGVGIVSVDGVFDSGRSEIHTLSAQATNSDTIVNSSGGSQEFFYDFTVFGPSLSLTDFVGVADSDIDAPTASYDMSILVNGASVWNSSAVLHGGTGGHELLESGTDLGGTFFTDSDYSSIFGYDFNDYLGTVSLGIFDDSESFLFETVMEVIVSSYDFELGGRASIGDPGDITGSGFGGVVSAQSLASTAVPEPSVIALFGLGLAGVVFSRRKKSV